MAFVVAVGQCQRRSAYCHAIEGIWNYTLYAEGIHLVNKLIVNIHGTKVTDLLYITI